MRALRELMDGGATVAHIACMFEIELPDFADKAAAYASLEKQLRALLHGERDFIANCANTAALLWQAVPDLNWAGVYRLDEHGLVLGPFQGKPACVRIRLGRGVCGTAAETRKTVLVPDVRKFPGHIACDAASRSEIVVPLMKDGALLGVLDLDSPKPGRFDAADQSGLERLAAVLAEASGPDQTSSGSPMERGAANRGVPAADSGYSKILPS